MHHDEFSLYDLETRLQLRCNIQTVLCTRITSHGRWHRTGYSSRDVGLHGSIMRNVLFAFLQHVHRHTMGLAAFFIIHHGVTAVSMIPPDGAAKGRATHANMSKMSRSN